MKEKFEKLLEYTDKQQATDVHFSLSNGELNVSVRGIEGIKTIKDKKIDVRLFNYLKYISNLDLGNSYTPQSGNFAYVYKKQHLFFRFAYMKSLDVESGVLRILNNHKKFKLEDLSQDQSQIKLFNSWCHFRSGLVLISGPTGSGKSTTLNAILESISSNNKLKVVSLEDPIEIHSDNYLQFQINERINFTYEEGIKQLLRHDPDVIMIGEVRDENSAKMLIRAALSGHMVFTTIHAKSCQEAIKRMINFGISSEDLIDTLTGLTNQRIFPYKNKNKRICIYETMRRDEIIEYLKNQENIKHTDIFEEIRKAYEKGWINFEEASFDIKI